MADDETDGRGTRVDLAEDRTILANERTFAGWLRTGLATVAARHGVQIGFAAADLVLLRMVRGAQADAVVVEGAGVRREVTSMPGVFQLSVDEAVSEARGAWADGVPAVLLFGLPPHKDDVGSGAYDARGPVQEAVRAMRRGR